MKSGAPGSMEEAAGKRRTFVPVHFAAACLLVVGCAMSALPVRAQSLYADPKAHRAGDVLTIILAERTAAQRESSFENESGSRMGGSAGVDEGSDVLGRFALDASFDRSHNNRNETVQRDLLRGTITAVVVDVDDTGNLVIEGERKLNVNGVTHLMRVSGKVRPFDIRHDNTVLSHQIADAFIEYRRAGFGRKYIKPGFVAKVGAVALLGAAAYYVTQ